MLNKILKLSKQFVSIPSTSNNKKALNDILDLALKNLRGYTMEKFENNGVKSALVFNSKIRPRRFKILLNGHLDVVPGKEEKYKPRIIKNKLYGIGSMDMKAGASCLITAFSKVADKVKYPLGLQLVTDEEIGGFCGTKFQIKNGVNSGNYFSHKKTSSFVYCSE